MVTSIFSPNSTEIKHVSLPTRASLKLQLMRQQVQDEEKREQQQQYSQSYKSSFVPTTTIDMPPARQQTSEVPPQVLQVDNFKILN